MKALLVVPFFFTPVVSVCKNLTALLAEHITVCQGKEVRLLQQYRWHNSLAALIQEHMTDYYLGFFRTKT